VDDLFTLNSYSFFLLHTLLHKNKIKTLIFLAYAIPSTGIAHKVKVILKIDVRAQEEQIYRRHTKIL
jgi:hypothetical protein